MHQFSYLHYDAQGSQSIIEVGFLLRELAIFVLQLAIEKLEGFDCRFQATERIFHVRDKKFRLTRLVCSPHFVNWALE